MAETGQRIEVQIRKLHPFFVMPTALSNTDDVVNPPTPESSCGPAPDKLGDSLVENLSQHCDSSEPKKKRRKKNPSAATETLPAITHKTRRARLSAGPSIIKHFGLHNTKERGCIVEQTRADELEEEPSSRDTNLLSTQPSKSVVETGYNAMTNEENRKVSGLQRDKKSQRLLKLNPETGTIGSPPRPKTSATSSALTPARNGAKRSQKSQAFVLTIPYGEDVASRERIGQEIEEMFLGTPEIISPVSSGAIFKTPPPSEEPTKSKVTTTSPKRATQNTPTSQKPAHPFFQTRGKKTHSPGDSGQKMAEEKSLRKRQVVFTSTPCPPKPTPPTPSSLSVPTLGPRNGGLRIPGAQHPAWPWRDMVHVRDNASSGLNDKASPQSITVTSKRRKAKGQATQVTEDESILYGKIPRVTLHQLADDIDSTNSDDFHHVAPSLVRVPIRSFESGRKLQARVSKELYTLKKKDDISKTHPAIVHAYRSIAIALSAFDRSTCESVAWSQKYAPTSAHFVLQTGREAVLLRNWLQTLNVQAVDTGASNNGSKPKSTPVRNKKRRHKHLDGFVVSGDSEDDDMDEISEDESKWLTPGSQGELKKTVVRSGDMVDRKGKLTNAVLLSGPHGCGKTATVYAIAKELDFEVFEINAGARRSGKDILERVGDMTRNHLVQHQHKEKSQHDTATDDEYANDLKSGKQGMMTSFFKPKSSKSTKKGKKVDHVLESQSPKSQEKKSRGDKKQSLILLEEVDILYEEDKQFWGTVISMIAQSKRPFIMTCNNESVIPLQNLKLHGIFRFSSPPIDLAVDMLMLIAANEGHVLRRHAIETLYASRGHDLRASITELQYWCQFGVGDPRGGFDWFYPRWPKGRDVDEEGQTIRVVSQDTFHTGMGWFSRDLIDTESLWPSTIPQVHGDVWNHWGLDISDHHEFEDASQWGKNAIEQAASRAAHIDLLRSIEAFTESISDSDICGPFLPPLSNNITLDATMPGIHARTLGDFTIDYRLLEATPQYHHNSISPSVSTSVRILARSKLLASQPSAGDVCLAERFDEKHVTGDIKFHLKMSLQSENPITRRDYSLAFDPIATSEKTLTGGYMDSSVFDREMVPICLDVAPYVRSIVAYDQRLHNDRRMRSNLLSQGGKPNKKRMRTTRSALSALEGGSRATTRREKYFAADVNPYLVMRTSGEGWDELTHPTEGSGDKANTGQERSDMDSNVDASSD
ncbi:hypothetical protein GGS21DRAFT_510664 [Xylaria nigripes]|nr:hypothetical protein GGS21DRAFT_510664 [Xylaria nigripes]